MNTIYVQNMETSFGELVLGAYHDKLCFCSWDKTKEPNHTAVKIQKKLNAELVREETWVIKSAILQLREYFERKSTLFDVPLLPLGTFFQVRVWNALMNIPFGETLSYQELTGIFGNANAIRAVAAANGANPLAVFIPCHRVIGSDGKLTGYAGGLDIKRKLLQLESSHKYPAQLQLFDD